TTNGTLLTEEMLGYFEEKRFALTLSFDGLVQEIDRKKGTLEQMVRLVQAIRQHPGIDFEINSVFTPRTIGRLSAAIRFMIEPGGPGITFNLTTMEQWEPLHLEVLKRELERLSDYLELYHRETGEIPVTNFRPPATGTPAPGIFRCGAGQNRMAVTPEGRLWGCYLFHDYFKNKKDVPAYGEYSFGRLADFKRKHDTLYAGISGNYSELRQDFFQVEEESCFLCKDVKGCMVCPVNAAYSSGELGKITCNSCKLNKLRLKAQRNFHKKLKVK
ncbi:MAG: hypothetical protein GY757_59065, partial [bacterium]|nr:hypothetical protein [bacterium]